MTKINLKEPEGKSPEDLYREYQILRDNIPLPTYASLTSAAENAVHEDNIEMILQRAKAFQPEAEKSRVSNPTESFFSSLRKRVFGDNMAPNRGWGTAFASVALAAVAIPFALNFSSQVAGYEQLEHFNDCNNCVSYIENSAVGTRSAVPGLNKFQPKQSFDARLGRIYADLKILASMPGDLDQQEISRQVARLRALPANFHGPNLALQLSKSKLKHRSLISAISDDQILDSSVVFLAAESLEIANITARLALDEKSDREVASSFAQAFAHLEEATRQPSLQNNTLAKNTLNELSEHSEKNALLNDPAKLKRLISLYSQALKSLGI